MSDSSDWKQKYRDSLLAMQADEKRWLQTEQVLRRLVGRLCAAGMGVDGKLDRELSELAAANRRNAGAEELARMAASLTTTVVQVDHAFPLLQPLSRSPLPLQLLAAVSSLLERLPLANSQGASRQGLLTALKAADTETSLAAVFTRIADLIHAHSDALAKDRLQAASVLAEVTKRLEEVASYLSESSNASQSRYAAAQSHNDSVLWQVRELTGEVSSAVELNALQRLVCTRLERVTREVSEFRAREECRLLESNGRAEQMRSRILALEHEAQDLNAKLLSEKQEARLDPLTGVANRKSFEEQMTRVLAAAARGEGAVAILLWDIDNFKQINDTYGHRAGDRVLQSVAGCFAAAARHGDFVARIGGEEFVLLVEAAAIAETLQLANQVRTAVQDLRFHFRGSPVKVTISCGVSKIRPNDTQAAAYERADAALYRAKHGGKNLCGAA